METVTTTDMHLAENGKYFFEELVAGRFNLFKKILQTKTSIQY
jgi:hypothetical protein